MNIKIRVRKEINGAFLPLDSYTLHCAKYRSDIVKSIIPTCYKIDIFVNVNATHVIPEDFLSGMQIGK